ncbi:unnamed protein product [Medioppia subpectinata]|uniref:Uncharacterized protein n=1 Tax=Medioppia subpectinata TaxID=1979941 RepID=A0A7R9KZN9_9ACAR|nr:unnamed protein product [Medioppia subpectinata]CAG2112883.1 unnamed protein product [Medioppia subpectinata]
MSGDLKIVRGQMRTMSQHIDSAAYESRDVRNIDMNIISEMEFYKNKVILLERDLQSVLDEKEELILNRDSYKLKVDRLNEQLNGLMRSGYSTGGDTAEDNRIVDIDSLFMENRFLKEKIKTFEDEKKLISLRLNKYKEILEKKRSQSPKPALSSAKTTMASIQLTAGNVITARQVEELIATDALNNMEVTANNLSQLRNLVIALFDGLQDKSISLSHSKKTNKVLGKRLEELENQLRSVRNKDKLPIVKAESLESNTSSNTNTTSNVEDVVTPDDELVDDEDEGDGPDEDELPPELDRLVKDAIHELKIRDLDEPNGQTMSSTDTINTVITNY